MRGRAPMRPVDEPLHESGDPGQQVPAPRGGDEVCADREPGRALRDGEGDRRLAGLVWPRGEGRGGSAAGKGSPGGRGGGRPFAGSWGVVRWRIAGGSSPSFGVSRRSQPSSHHWVNRRENAPI